MRIRIIYTKGRKNEYFAMCFLAGRKEEVKCGGISFDDAEQRLISVLKEMQSKGEIVPESKFIEI